MSLTLRALARDERGTSLIELGLALSILTTLFLGMIDMSFGYAARLKLEQAAQSTIETVQQTGYTHSTTSLATLEAEAQTRAGTGSVATASAYLECGTARTKVAAPGNCTAGQAAARYVSVSLVQPYSPVMGTAFATKNANGTYTLTGNAALRIQ